MSEAEKTERTVETVRQEYTALCAKAGHIAYQIYTLNKELEMINSSLRDLNVEAISLESKKDSQE